MRLSVSKNQNRFADVFCDDARKAKKQLLKNSVTQLYVDHYLVGRENGHQLLTWALHQQLMPLYVVVTERQLQKRQAMIHLLETNGYRSADGMNFIKYY
ncbi:hypothetical protein AB835_05865 [Candidatus Endobugula sertula]|uniref:Uncharacterized protein n=1 Tax=Candidatus Endobugula sertula TaxID=62101 RepID=A0A1D2QR27_9GAMM|nr:hypothetical protein AB835_05865 [Candidatus Endobugula sertula]